MRAGPAGEFFDVVGLGLAVAPIWLLVAALLLGATAVLLCFLLLRARRQLSETLAEADTLRTSLARVQKFSSLGQLSAGVAHEINNPLAVIGQEAELLAFLMSQPDQESVREELETSLDSIQSQIRRASDVTRRLLDFARSPRAVIQNLDLRALAEDMAVLVERDVSRRGVQLNKNFWESPLLARSDAPLLRQVVINLLQNAVQAAPDHDGEISLSGWSERSFACLEVADNGPGVSKEDANRLFTPFFTTKPPGQGVGLGLAVSKRIMHSLGGDLTLESQPGQGARFRLWVPKS
ncbi:MAG: two-component system, NtrC family, sensor kinase [Desulfovibrionales bacterium]|nr:two-component system, NtrC family, sensor kinase [Desulfovibrionales bacterium]